MPAGSSSRPRSASSSRARSILIPRACSLHPWATARTIQISVSPRSRARSHPPPERPVAHLRRAAPWQSPVATSRRPRLRQSLPVRSAPDGRSHAANFISREIAAMQLLSVENLRTSYTSHGHTLHAVDGVSLEVGEHETVGLVGESGCGKSTLGKTIVRLLRPSGGAIRLNGEDISQLNERSLRTVRRTVQMVFQDPFGSLNPRQRVGTILDTPLKVHGVKDPQERRRRIL